jgi:hypothetical protein
MTRGDKLMNNFPKLLLAVVFGASVSLVLAADWNSNLQGGGVVSVDPDTLRATVTRDGVTTPLWNGVHRMQDGSALIVNHGEAVPGAPASSPPRQLPAPESEDWEGALIAGYSPCEQLARHVCGMQGECATAEACIPSRQLLAMEDEERRQAVDRSRMTYTSGQCIKARADEVYFSACRTGK